jgi:hypothetical protein
MGKEIDDGRCSRKKTALEVLLSREEGAPGRRIFGWTTHATSEDKEIPRDVHRRRRASPAGNDAAAGSSRRRRV